MSKLTAMKPMRVLMVVPRIDIYQGGPSYSATSLCKSLANCGLDITLFTTEPIGEVPPKTGDEYEVRYFPLSFPKRYGNSNGLIEAINGTARDYNIVHIHNLWNFITTRSAMAARRLGIPYVITPGGMLSAWKRTTASLHKEFYFRLFDRKIIRCAAFIHFLNKHEAANSHDLLEGTTEKIVPNGIWPKDFDELRPEAFRAKFGLGDNPFVAFLGRLHPIKNLSIQCEAFKLLADKIHSLRWVFIGPDEGTAREIARITGDAGLKNRVVMTGALSGKDRLSALAASSVYCHTSRHEAHSIAITEALAAGRPCVVTKGCHFDDIADSKAGTVVNSDPQAIADAIERIVKSPELTRTMGSNAVSLAIGKYSWDLIGKRMAEAYRNI